MVIVWSRTIFYLMICIGSFNEIVKDKMKIGFNNIVKVFDLIFIENNLQDILLSYLCTRLAPAGACAIHNIHPINTMAQGKPCASRTL